MIDQEFIHNCLINEVLYNIRLKIKTEINLNNGTRNIKFQKLFNNGNIYNINTSYNQEINKWEYKVLCNNKEMTNDEIYILFAEINCNYQFNSLNIKEY